MTRPGAPPLIDSHDITLWFLEETAPSFLPTELKDTILPLKAELHGINFFALTFYGYTPPAARTMPAIREKLARNDISETYRRNLEHKAKA